uniref:Uncharacterized protein n=1 Tax=Acrobeloides nanus TaxID=290746 RepID=A0A914DI50_9BILA
MKLPYTTMRDTIRRYRETGNYNDRPRSGRPRTARTPAKIRKIKGRIQRNPNSRRNSTRQMAKGVRIGRSSVQRILHDDLGMKARKMPHQSIEALKKSLVKAWNAIPQEVIDRAVDDFPKRLMKCIDAQVGHFENK